jgi:16S rRNA (cytosine1402-N4)-methyltransferase
LQLAETVERSIPRAAWPKDIHVATRTFQALRIAVNDELGQLQAGLTDAISRLKPGGRLAVLSYHSLEDRIVKQRFLEAAGRAPSAPGSSPAAFLNQGFAPTLEIVTRKPILPTGEEIARNPRARSARLRVARRVE